jgi:hypothetical protein
MLSKFSISAGSALKRPAVRECSEAAAGLSAGWARFGGCGATWGAASTPPVPVPPGPVVPPCRPACSRRCRSSCLGTKMRAVLGSCAVSPPRTHPPGLSGALLHGQPSGGVRGVRAGQEGEREAPLHAPPFVAIGGA